MVDKLGSKRSAAAWKAIRADYESATLTLNSICQIHSLALQDLLARAKASGWRRDGADAIDRRILINKLLGLLERQIEQLDLTAVAPTSDKDVAVLNKLAASLEKLIAMDKAEASGNRADDEETDEVRDIRIKLAKRIDALTKG